MTVGIVYLTQQHRLGAMVRQAVLRAAKDSISTARENVKPDIALAVATVAFGIVPLLRGGQGMSPLLQAVAVAAMPFGLAGLAVFVFHLCRAPGKLRQEREAKALADRISANNSAAMFGWILSLLKDPDLCVDEAFVFGSSLVAFPPPEDVDIAIRFAHAKMDKLRKAHATLMNYSVEFEKMFKHPLDLELFLHNERERWERIQDNASLIKWMIGGSDGQDT